VSVGFAEMILREKLGEKSTTANEFNCSDARSSSNQEIDSLLKSKSARFTKHDNVDYTKTGIVRPGCVSNKVPAIDTDISTVSDCCEADFNNNEQSSRVSKPTTSERCQNIRSVHIYDVVQKDKDMGLKLIPRSFDDDVGNGSEIGLSKVKLDVAETSRYKDREEKDVNTTLSVVEKNLGKEKDLRAVEKNLGKEKDLRAVLANDQGMCTAVKGNLCEDGDLTTVSASVETARSKDENLVTEEAKRDARTADPNCLLLKTPDECLVWHNLSLLTIFCYLRRMKNFVFYTCLFVRLAVWFS